MNNQNPTSVHSGTKCVSSLNLQFIFPARRLCQCFNCYSNFLVVYMICGHNNKAVIETFYRLVVLWIIKQMSYIAHTILMIMH